MTPRAFKRSGDGLHSGPTATQGGPTRGSADIAALPSLEKHGQVAELCRKCSRTRHARMRRWSRSRRCWRRRCRRPPVGPEDLRAPDDHRRSDDQRAPPWTSSRASSPTTSSSAGTRRWSWRASPAPATRSRSRRREGRAGRAHPVSAANTLTTNVGFFKKMPYDPVNGVTPIATWRAARWPWLFTRRSRANTLQRADRSRQEAAGRAELRIDRSGHAAAPRHGDVVAARRREDAAHPVSGLGGRAARIARRVRQDDVPADAPFDFAGGARQAPAARRQRKAALPQFPDVPTLAEAGFAGVEVEFLVRHDRPGRTCRPP